MAELLAGIEKQLETAKPSKSKRCDTHSYFGTAANADRAHITRINPFPSNGVGMRVMIFKPFPLSGTPSPIVGTFNAKAFSSANVANGFVFCVLPAHVNSPLVPSILE
jgi:hypothetical protein